MTNALKQFLERSYTAYQAVENAERLLRERGFLRLSEREPWKLDAGGRYYVVRGGSALIAFSLGKRNAFRIVASHTDSPCLKLKENPVLETEGVYKLNTEPYGGGIYYSFFDRPLKLAGRVITEERGALVSKNVVSPFQVVIPSLAVHMQRDVNEKFAPNPQTDLMPVLSLRKKEFESAFGAPVSFDLFAACAEPAFPCGTGDELLSSPRVDNLTGVFSSLNALCESAGDAICVAACLDNEETGSLSYQGAGSGFLRSVLHRVAQSRNLSDEERERALADSFLTSLDNAHSLHPNHPEKCDPTNRAVLGGGLVVKEHANKAYTTDALTSAVVKTIFRRAGVKYQIFCNRSDMRSGGTLGAISLSQTSVPSVDLGIAQLAMHSAVETFAVDDFRELLSGLVAYYSSDFSLNDCGAQF